MGFDFKFFTRKGISARVIGADRALRSMIGFSNETFKVSKKRFNRMLIILRKEIRDESPVDTGDLRKSVKILKNIKRRSGDFEGEVGPDGSAVNRVGTSYAPFVIFGTRFRAANNFPLRGQKNAIPKIRREVIKMRLDLKSIIRKVKSKG